MSAETWFSFVIASSVMLAIPGPTVLLVLSYALSQGKQTARATIPGVALGDLTAMTISLLGAGAVLAASASLFTLLKLAGAAYLIWLGIRLWRAKITTDHTELLAENSCKTMFWNAYLVTALNPKSIVFFIAFVPQFINPEQPVLRQFAILEMTFISLAILTVTLWSLFAGQMRQRLQQPRLQRLANRTGGSLLLAAGIFTATVRA